MTNFGFSVKVIWKIWHFEKAAIQSIIFTEKPEVLIFLKPICFFTSKPEFNLLTLHEIIQQRSL
jgi:hypothetical protein